MPTVGPCWRRRRLSALPSLAASVLVVARVQCALDLERHAVVVGVDLTHADVEGGALRGEGKARGLRVSMVRELQACTLILAYGAASSLPLVLGGLLQGRGRC